MNADDWRKAKEIIDRKFERVKWERQARLEMEAQYSPTPPKPGQGERAKELRARRKRRRERKWRREFMLKYYGSLKKPLVISTSTAEFIEGARLLTGQNLYKTCGDIIDMLNELSQRVTINQEFLTQVKAVRGYAKRFGWLDFVELELPGKCKVVGHQKPS